MLNYTIEMEAKMKKRISKKAERLIEDYEQLIKSTNLTKLPNNHNRNWLSNKFQFEKFTMYEESQITVTSTDTELIAPN